MEPSPALTNYVHSGSLMLKTETHGYLKLPLPESLFFNVY